MEVLDRDCRGRVRDMIRSGGVLPLGALGDGNCRRRAVRYLHEGIEDALAT